MQLMRQVLREPPRRPRRRQLFGQHRRQTEHWAAMKALTGNLKLILPNVSLVLRVPDQTQEHALTPARGPWVLPNTIGRDTPSRRVWRKYGVPYVASVCGGIIPISTAPWVAVNRW